MIFTELVNLVVADWNLEIWIKVAPVSGYANHDDVGEEDDDGEEVKGMVDRQGPVTEGRCLIAPVHTHQIENVLKYWT